MKQIRYIFTILLLTALFSSCVEEIDLQSETEFENVLVIEATITNELKRQEIILSRTFPLEEDGPNPESNASVKVIGSNGSEFVFQEDEEGTYLSSQPFSAQSNVDYQIEIVTNDGEIYGSSTMQLTQETQIDDLFFEVGLNEDNEEGISVFVNSYDPTGNSKFYRYTYEETYKIIAPFYNPTELVVIEHNIPSCPILDFQLKEEQEQICYNTVASSDIILENTNLFDEDRIERFRLRFLNRNNYIISYRYSILVRQYTQSSEAHIYYKTLRDLSTLESLLSPTQPGFIAGNVFSITNNNKKVLGFFEVSSVDYKRIYFNYSDLYPGELLPPYYINCNLYAPELCDPAGNSNVVSELSQGNKYYADNLFPDMTEGPYDFVLAPCGDCTVLGKNTPPDFWEED